MAIPRTAVMMHHIGEVQETIPMGFKAEDFAHLACVLEGLYSNPVAAVLREYSTNAWDSHVMSGNLSPIEITLPTADRLEFVVQDYGVGMSVDDLRNTYAFFGASDKRDSNEVAGQLGLGSKSGLSYADLFVVTAVKGGVKTVAYITKNAHGLGEIQVQDTCATDQPNGVRITVPVDRYDVNKFREEATNLFQFWSAGSVLIDGEVPAEPSWLATSLRLDEDTILVRNDSGLYSSYVVMGNVPYPVDDARTGRVSRRFVARLNIGDVDHAPSREDVKHTPHTDATLAELAEHIAARFKVALTGALATADTRWAETVLKALWMDRNLSLRASQDRPIWTYNPGISWGRKALAHLSTSVAAMAQGSTWVITGFAAKNVSQTARERLVEFAGSKASFVIIPAGVQGIGQLEGHPATVAWDEVVGATVKPKADKAARGPKFETQYAVIGMGSMTAAQLAALSGKVLYLNPNENAPRGTLGATVVSLYSTAQLARVKRFVPGIVHYEDELLAQRQAALKALTAQDKRIAQARTLPSMFQALNHAKVDDLELAEAIRLSKAADTDTMTAAKALGVGVPSEGATDFNARYPLLNGGGYYHNSTNLNAERLFYVNARYNANQAAAAEAVAS